MASRYARVDRRPLDPPPVVLLRLYRVSGAGTNRESQHELDYNEVNNLGLICHVDLFSVNNFELADVQEMQSHLAQSASSEDVPNMVPMMAFDGVQQDTPVCPVCEELNTGEQRCTCENQTPEKYVQIYNGSGMDAYEDLPDAAEASKCTKSLVGDLYVQSIAIDYEGERVLVFPFTDLAVRLEGYFILRYRVFDINSKPVGTDDIPIIAQCYGNTFRIYSTKDFPGLPPSTELTKRWGVRLNVRETERKRKKNTQTSVDGWSDSETGALVQ
ncbi:hypothetical protein HWV62_199 [Athelia sp. TMB]|nr:hypothetical protein HWV62_199 [Athelia sp. TMB]